jgi:hypothetical protein
MVIGLVRSWGSSTLHHINIFYRDRSSIAVEDDEYGKANGCLGGGDGQYEQGKDLAGQISEIGGKGDKVDVDRQKDELDRHQNYDDVLAVEKDAGDSKRKHDRGNDEVMVDADHR